MAWATSANWPTSESNKPKTSSSWAMKSGSSASGWMKKAVSGFRAAPQWPSAIRKWAAVERRLKGQALPRAPKAASSEATQETGKAIATTGATVMATAGDIAAMAVADAE